MKAVKLIQHNDTLMDLLYWIKRFMADKIINGSKTKVSDDFDMAALVQQMLSDSTDTIEKVVSIGKLARTQGMKSVEQYYVNIEPFYRFIEKNVDKFPSITNIFGITLLNFANKEHSKATPSKKNLLFGTARNFFNFIDDNTLKGEHLFHITKNASGGTIKRVHRKEQPKKFPVFLTEEEMHRFNKSLLKIEYKSKYEQNRDILIGRLFLFSGITTSELLELKDSDLTIDEEDHDVMWVHINGKAHKRRDIPIPKRKVVVYLNAYREARGESLSGLLFCNAQDSTKPLSDHTVRGVIKAQFEAAKIKKDEVSPTVLRNSFAIFLYRKLFLDGMKSPERYVQTLMGHSSHLITLKLVKFSNPKSMIAASAFADFVESL